MYIPHPNHYQLNYYGFYKDLEQRFTAAKRLIKRKYMKK